MLDEFLEWQANFKPKEITEEMTEAVIKEIKSVKPFDVIGTQMDTIIKGLK